jgi:hypothetical protein
MTDSATVGEILAQYEKHGWKLRRALLSDEGMALIGPTLGDVETFGSDIDALWFSRRSNPESEAWELRRLTNLPFALVAVITNGSSAEEVEFILDQVVDEMRSKTIA